MREEADRRFMKHIVQRSDEKRAESAQRVRED